MWSHDRYTKTIDYQFAIQSSFIHRLSGVLKRIYSNPQPYLWNYNVLSSASRSAFTDAQVWTKVARHDKIVRPKMIWAVQKTDHC